MRTHAVAAIRFGYGLGPRGGPAEAEGILAALAGPDRAARRHPMMGIEAAVDLAGRFHTARRERAGNDAAFQEIRAEVAAVSRDALRLTLARILDADSAFRERLVQFWADHFTARPTATIHGLYVQPYLDQAIRPHVTGRFGDMLKAVATSPLMLIYLDQRGSIGPTSAAGRNRDLGLNENYARELLELHTLGVDGSYRQGDIAALARLLTGLHFTPNDGFVFRDNFSEPGPHGVLGRSYGGEAPDLDAVHAVLDDLSVHPDTAGHLARKLAVHFLHDDPPEALVAAMAGAWRRSGGDLMQVYAALLDHPAAWTPELRKVKWPLDFIASALVALGVEGAQVARMRRQDLFRQIDRPLREMGQAFMAPPGPDGWPEDPEDWVTPQGLASRIRWSLDVPSRMTGGALPDPRDFVATALGPQAPDRLERAVAGAETQAQGVGLVLSSPAFNRR